MPWKLRIDHKIKNDMLACDDDARREIGRFVSDLQTNAYPAGSHVLKPLKFFAKLDCGYFISWEAIPDLSKPPSITEPKLAEVRVLGVGRNPPGRRGRTSRNT